MKSIKVFVDGQEGTTGLKIHERLADRRDVELVLIDPALRKDSAERGRCIARSDVTFLCLPDDASREAVSLVPPGTTKFIDASTAFRTNPEWVYGMPELGQEHRRRLEASSNVAVPGCHASGFILGLAPLVRLGALDPGARLTAYSLTGYSGGGKKMIAQYDEAKSAGSGVLDGPRHYALGLTHKHLPEMKAYAGLTYAPAFLPVVGNFFQGMVVSTVLHGDMLGPGWNRAKIHRALQESYAGQTFVRVMPLDDPQNLDAGFLDPCLCNGTNRADIFVFGNDDELVIATRLDNLGKGASGAAVQCMNIIMGIDEATGLTQ